MKNCAPALSGFPGTSTAATDPRVIFAARGSAFTAFNPPVPYSSRFAGSADSGSPPWTIPYFTTWRDPEPTAVSVAARQLIEAETQSASEIALPSQRVLKHP